MTRCCPPPRMRWSGAIGALARGKRVSTGCGRTHRFVRAWRWICGVKPTLKAGNTPSPHCIVHGLGKPGGFTTVSKSLSFCHLTKQPLINELEDRVDERHSRHDGSSSDYRPKFRVFTEKAYVPRVIIT